METIHWTVCIAYVTDIHISQKYLKINGLGQFLSSLKKGTAYFGHRIVFVTCSFVCACGWVEICHRKAQQKKKQPEFGSETNESVISFLSCKCRLSCSESCDIISWCLTVSVKRRYCRRAWTRKKDSSTMAKNNPKKICFSEQGPSPLYPADYWNRKQSIAGKCLCDLCFQLHKSPR